MTPRTCPRCHSTLHSEEGTSLVYCWSCGTPQVTLSEALQEQLAHQQLNAQNGGAVPLPPGLATDPTDVIWSRVIQLAGIAGAVIVGLSLVMAIFPPVALLALFWGIGAPIILLGVYCARTPLTRVTTGLGARLGLLCGLAIALATFVVQTGNALLMRFAFHQGFDIDTKVNAFFATLQAQMLAQSTGETDAAALQQFFHWFTIPEFRIGILLCVALMVVCFYLVYAALAGAFAGFLRARARAS